MPENVYFPKSSSAPPEFKHIVGKGSSTSWFSPTPANSSIVFTDIAFTVHCMERGDWGLGNRVWLSMLMDGPNLLVKHKANPTWSFVLTTVGFATLAWPAKPAHFLGSAGNACATGGLRCFLPDLDAATMNF